MGDDELRQRQEHVPRRHAAANGPQHDPVEKEQPDGADAERQSPSAQVKSETLILLVAIWPPAAGAVRVSDSVQSRFCSMATAWAG